MHESRLNEQQERSVSFRNKQYVFYRPIMFTWVLRRKLRGVNSDVFNGGAIL